MNIEFTNEEISNAVKLFDLAVRANGLIVSEIAINLTKKFQEALKNSDE